MDLSVAHIDVPERAALLFVPYPHGRDAAVGSVMVQGELGPAVMGLS